MAIPLSIRRVGKTFTRTRVRGMNSICHLSIDTSSIVAPETPEVPRWIHKMRRWKLWKGLDVLAGRFLSLLRQFLFSTEILFNLSPSYRIGPQQFSSCCRTRLENSGRQVRTTGQGFSKSKWLMELQSFIFNFPRFLFVPDFVPFSFSLGFFPQLPVIHPSATITANFLGISIFSLCFSIINLWNRARK